MAVGADPEDYGFSFAKANLPPKNPFEAVRPVRPISSVAQPAAARASPGRDRPSSPMPATTSGQAPTPISGSGFTFYRPTGTLSRPTGQPHPLSQSTLPSQPTPPHVHSPHAAPAMGWKSQQRIPPPFFGGLGRRTFHSGSKEQGPPLPQKQQQQQTSTPRRPVGVSQTGAFASARSMTHREGSAPGRDGVEGSAVPEGQQTSLDVEGNEEEPMLWTVRRDPPQPRGQNLVAAVEEAAEDEGEDSRELAGERGQRGHEEANIVAVSSDPHQGDHHFACSASPPHAQPSFGHQPSSEETLPVSSQPHERHSLPSLASVPMTTLYPTHTTAQQPYHASRATLAGSVRQGQEQMNFHPQLAQPCTDKRPEASPAPVPKRRYGLVEGTAEVQETRESPAKARGASAPVARARYEGSSEQTLLVLLQQKNGEIDNLRKEAQRLNDVIERKEQQNDDLERDHQRLAQAYRQDEETWKTSMSNAKKWRDTIKNRELVKTQAAQELTESYEAQSASLSSALDTLSQEVKELKEDGVGNIKEDLTRHASSLSTVRQALDDVKKEMQEQGNAVEELKNVKALNLHLENTLARERRDLGTLSVRNGDLEHKVESFENSLAPSLEKVMREMAILRKSSDGSSAEIETLLKYQHDIHEQLASEAKTSEQLRHQLATVTIVRDSLEATMKKSITHLKTLGCEGDNIKSMVGQLETKYRDELSAVKANCEKHTLEYENTVAQLENKLNGVETQLSESRSRAQHAEEKLRQVEQDLSSKLAVATAEHRAVVDGLQKEMKIMKQEKDKLICSLEETQAREQGLKDKVTGLTQSNKDASAQLHLAQTIHQGECLRMSSLEQQIQVLQGQLVHATKVQDDASNLSDWMEALRHNIQDVASTWTDAFEMERVKHEADSKTAHITRLQADLDTARHTSDKLASEMRKLKTRLELVAAENTGLRESAREREADTGSLLERWDHDQLNPEEVMLVQKVTQQIKCGEQAFYRQELDDKSNAIKKLESRCKKLEAQVSALSHEKIYSSTGQLNADTGLQRMVTEATTTLSSPLSEPPSSSTAVDKIPSPHDSLASPKTSIEINTLSLMPSKPTSVGASKGPTSTAPPARKRQLIDPDEQDLDDNAEPHDHELGQDADGIDEVEMSVPATQYNLPSVKQVSSSKPQKRASLHLLLPRLASRRELSPPQTRFADIIPSSDNPGPKPEDADDPIETPPTSQMHSQHPPPSQNPKTHRQRGSAKSAIRTRSSLEDVGYAGVAEKSEREKKKARGPRKTN